MVHTITLEWNPVWGGAGQTIVDCDKPVVPHPEAAYAISLLVLYGSLTSSKGSFPGQCLSLRALRGLTI